MKPSFKNLNQDCDNLQKSISACIDYVAALHKHDATLMQMLGDIQTHALLADNEQSGLSETVA